MNVLLAEDNPVNQEIAVGLLETLDCAVTVVGNGREAVDAAVHGRFDILLMDCQMPVMDGFEATRSIRAAARHGTRLPIVALTASSRAETEADCLDAGMDDLLGKPFSRGDLTALLQRWCRGIVEAPPAPPIEDEPVEAASLDSGPLDLLKGLDPTGEKGLLRRAIEKFVGYGDDAVERLAVAARESDDTELARLAHSLKSSSANLGAMDLSRLCIELENAVKPGELPDDIDLRVLEITAAHRAARKALLALIDG